MASDDADPIRNELLVNLTKGVLMPLDDSSDSSPEEPLKYVSCEFNVPETPFELLKNECIKLTVELTISLDPLFSRIEFLI